MMGLAAAIGVAVTSTILIVGLAIDAFVSLFRAKKSVNVIHLCMYIFLFINNKINKLINLLYFIIIKNITLLWYNILNNIYL